MDLLTKQKRNKSSREWYNKNKVKVSKKHAVYYKKNREKILASNKAYKKANPEKYTSEDKRLYRLKNKEKFKIYKKTWLDKHPKIKKTRQQTRDLLKSGKIPRQECLFCKEKKVHAHHLNYNNPYNIVFLCHLHHIIIHKLLKRGVFYVNS